MHVDLFLEWVRFYEIVQVRFYRCLQRGVKSRVYSFAICGLPFAAGYRGIVRPDEFKKHYHQAIKDAGYHGIFNSSLPTDTMSHVVGLFHIEKPEEVIPMHQKDFKETSAYNHHQHEDKVQEASQMDSATDPEFLVNLSNNMKK